MQIKLFRISNCFQKFSVVKSVKFCRKFKILRTDSTSLFGRNFLNTYSENTKKNQILVLNQIKTKDVLIASN